MEIRYKNKSKKCFVKKILIKTTLSEIILNEIVNLNP